MLTPAQNERLTRVGPGTPMGETLRRYWQPALLSDEVPENDGAPVRVRILGEDLIAFRDTTGAVGLVSAYCPHRRAPMFFGRNEECGLRCVYHGWKFDRTGACVDMPSEPPDSLFKTKVRIEAYPTFEGGGLVWAYLGPPQTMPPQPDYEFVRVPATHLFMCKTFEDCNYLQALEGGLDSTHSSILHSRQGVNMAFLRNYEQIIPKVEVRRTDYGYVFSGNRQLEGRQWARISQYLMPAMHLRGTVQQIFRNDVEQPTVDGHIWVPIDDDAVWVYNFTYSSSPDQPLSRTYMEKVEETQGRGKGEVDANFRPVRNRSNDYGIDRAAQKTRSFTGIRGVNTQDFALQENMLRIVDRSKEHLSTIDQPVIVARQLLLEAIADVEAGTMPRGADPRTHRDVRPADEIIADGVDWEVALSAELVARY